MRALDPRLGDLRDRLYEKAYDANEPAGSLCPEWAARLGLAAGIPIAIGEFDVHYGAIGCGVREGTLVKVIGTSTCDCAVVSADKPVADIPGICGIVKGAILPGFFGIEAGQSAVGDIFKWWVEGICGGDAALHAQLSAEAAKQKPGQAGLLALDWNNGNRTILVDQLLSGLILGQDLYTTRADVYRALIEATAFGARAIIERIRGIWRADRQGRLQRRDRREKPAADADLRRRNRPRDACRRLEPELRAGLGDRRRGARRRPSGLRRRGRSDDVSDGQALRTGRGEPERLRSALCAVSRPSRQLRRPDEIGGPLSGHEDASSRSNTLRGGERIGKGASALARVPRTEIGTVMINLGAPEIWFVCGSQHLYGPGPLQRVAANAREVAGALAESPKLPLKTVFKALLTTPDEIAKLCMDANSDENCAGLILWMHTFSPSKMWIRGLNALQKPFLHLHTQFNRDLPWDTIDMDFMNLNQSAHGDREAGFIHARMRLARKVVVGHWSDPEVQDRIGVVDARRARLA